jgi:hypothetical protein
VAIYHDYSHVYTHARSLRAGQRVTRADHMPPNAQAFASQDAGWCLTQAQAVGPKCHEFVSVLLRDDILIRLRAAQNVLRLIKKYGPLRLEAACQRALLHQSVQYQTVKSILHGNYDQLPLITPNEQPYAQGARYARDAHSLFSTH